MKDHVDGDLVSAVRRSCERSGVPGTVLAIETDDDVQDVAVGMAAIETVEEMRPDHQFPTMSLAKSMTAVMLLHLHLCDEVHPPGERFSYSNSSFSLAAAIAEAVAGDLYGGQPPRVCWRLSCARVSSGQLA